MELSFTNDTTQNLLNQWAIILIYKLFSNVVFLSNQELVVGRSFSPFVAFKLFFRKVSYRAITLS